MTVARSALAAFARHAAGAAGMQASAAASAAIRSAATASFASAAPSFARAGTGLAPRCLANAAAADAVAAARRAAVPFAASFARAACAPTRRQTPAAVSATAAPRALALVRRAFTSSAAAPLRASASSSSAAAAAAAPRLVAGGAFAERVVGAWLVGGCAWVFSMVVLGGVTRLTRSGLSMTDWKFQWESPPLSDADWAREFDKYRRSPEFKLANASMTVEEYKFIFWMEYGHRMWGRGLGVFFALPLCGFLYNGWITKKLGVRLLSFFALGAGQGFIGWWMVKSGLELDCENPLNVPRVSPYRLATHLTGAFTIYTAMLWTTFSVLFQNEALGTLANKSGVSTGPGSVDAARAAAVTSLRRKAFPLAGLIALTALSGAYVAGLDAGRAYNTFPLMDGKLVPDAYWADWSTKGWRNFFENDAAVQFDHRLLAFLTLASTTATHVSSRKTSALLPKRASFFLNATMGLVSAQVILGVATLLYHVPVSLGSAHQANALLVFTSVVGLTHALGTKSASGLMTHTRGVKAAVTRGSRAVYAAGR